MAQGDTWTNSETGQVAAGPTFPTAWQPLTPGGVAAFSHASLTRLFAVESLVAGLFAAVLLWFFYLTCLPVLRAAVSQLPDEGRIENQVLHTPHTKATPLAESRILAVAIDLHEESRAGLTSDFLLELHVADFEICSLLGCLVFPYPKNWSIEINRNEIEPWWSAWQPVIVTTFVLGVIFILLIAWSVLATLYSPIPWLVAYYSDRRLSVTGAWRLAAAALLPGAFVMMLSLCVYALGFLDLIQTAILMALHLPLGWIYIILSPWSLPRMTETEPVIALKENPFVPPPPPENDSVAAADTHRTQNPNPFAAPVPEEETTNLPPPASPQTDPDNSSRSVP